MFLKFSYGLAYFNITAAIKQDLRCALLIFLYGIYPLKFQKCKQPRECQLVMWAHPSHTPGHSIWVQAALSRHQRLRSTHYAAGVLTQRPQEFQVFACSVYRSTTKVDAPVVSAFDFWAEMVTIPFPKEILKYHRLKQQEEAAQQQQIHQLPHRKSGATGTNPDS